ncbi:MAG: hypothetical protein DRR42_21350 [Gammaproteobacteria bacterium]|nr:MAG: hypothetical protein DRR42_21350 [Gammaproteobacteria bacterium]
MASEEFIWEEVSIKSVEDSAQLKADIERLLKSYAAQASLDHNLTWLATREGEKDKAAKIFLCWSNGSLVGYAPFLGHPSSLGVDFAGRKVIQAKVFRYSLTRGPVIDSNIRNTELFCKNLVSALTASLQPNEIAFFLGLELEAPLGLYVLSNTAASAHVMAMKHGDSYQRRLIEFTNGFDGYMADLSSKNRQELKRQERKLIAVADENFETKSYTNAEDVEEFLKYAAKLSEKTYQSKLFGLRIIESEEVKLRLKSAAHEGWLRCYILFVDSAPAAFMQGYLYMGTYYSETIGYDPAWSKFSVGNVLHIQVTRDITASGFKVAFFDFMYGDNPNKSRLSNRSRLEQNIYLAPRTWRWRILITTIGMLNKAIEFLGAMADRHDLKSKFKRHLKHRATQ